MAHHDFTMPISDAQARALRVDDTVTLRGTLYGIRDATQIHMFDRGRRTRFDMAGHAVIHTAPNVRKTETGYEPVCVGTTTSDRMERFTRPLMQQYGVRLVIGKGGLRDDSLKSFAQMGGAYLAIIGGTAALETTWVEAIEDVDLDDLNPESLWISMTSIPSRCGSSASTGSAPCSLLWTATVRACIPKSGPQRSNGVPRR
jgi:L(+)-tartrate dehydratase beta subunit